MIALKFRLEGAILFFLLILKKLITQNNCPTAYENADLKKALPRSRQEFAAQKLLGEFNFPYNTRQSETTR